MTNPISYRHRWGVAVLATALLLLAPQALGQPGMRGWTGPPLEPGGWTLLEVFKSQSNELAVFAKPPGGTSGPVRTMSVRLEFRVPIAGVGLSNAEVYQVDCAGHRLHLASATMYSDNNLRGASHPADGWASWQVASGGPNGTIVQAACAYR